MTPFSFFDSTQEVVEIPEELIAKWQQTVDLAAQRFKMRAGLIMRIDQENLEVFISSDTEGNPYTAGDAEEWQNSGLYCERVIKSKEKLLVSDALKSEEWNQNPDLKLNMIAYIGFPILLPDGNPFGTICLLDDHEISPDSVAIDILKEFRNLIEEQIRVTILLEENKRRMGKIQKTADELGSVNQTLQESEEKFRLITEMTADVVWVFNVDTQKWVYISPAVEKLRGFTVEEAMAETMEESLAPESYERLKKTMPVSMKAFQEDPDHPKFFINEIQQPCKDGSMIWVELSSRYRYNAKGEIEVVGTSRNIDDRKRTEQTIHYMSTHDYLTGLYNRLYFDYRAEDEIALANRYGQDVSVMMIDFDHFKQVNDEYGHPIGDKLLKCLAEKIKTSVRDCDTSARIGGDEFVVLMPNTSLKDALVVAERVRSTIETSTCDKNHQQTVSIGLVEFQSGETLVDLYKRVDQALYRAKDNGRNCVVV